MSEQDDITRGAAEEAAEAPLTEAEEQTSRRPAGQPAGEADADLPPDEGTGSDLDDEELGL